MRDNSQQQQQQHYLRDVNIITPGPYIAQWVDPTATTERRISLLGSLDISQYQEDIDSSSDHKQIKQEGAKSPSVSVLCRGEPSKSIMVDCTSCLFSRHLFPLNKNKMIIPTSEKQQQTLVPKEKSRDVNPTTNEPKYCSICLDEYRKGDDVCTSKNGCKHLFHTTCILDWLTHNDDCPICRLPFSGEDREIDTNAPVQSEGVNNESDRNATAQGEEINDEGDTNTHVQGEGVNDESST